MSEGALGGLIRGVIRSGVLGARGRTPYREPLVGCAPADHGVWERIRAWSGPEHRMPGDLLPGARTVVAFFVPFGEPVVRSVRSAGGTTREWVTAYRETNALIDRITAELVAALSRRGVRAAAQPATHNFDPRTLASRWSHKSAAAAAGLGSFGLHRMLITERGCAGRCGSLVLDASLGPPAPAVAPNRCLFFHDGSCRACVERCPTGALWSGRPGEPNLDRHRCYTRLLEVEARTGADCCGLCAVGPCALGDPSRPAHPRGA